MESDASALVMLGSSVHQRGATNDNSLYSLSMMTNFERVQTLVRVPNKVCAPKSLFTSFFVDRHFLKLAYRQIERRMVADRQRVTKRARNREKDGEKDTELSSKILNYNVLNT